MAVNLLIMWFDLAPIDMEDGSKIYSVRVGNPERPQTLGWLRWLPSGWVLVGYDDDPLPFFRDPDEAVRGLYERDCLEQDTADWPVVRG
jgi:hypothetical protein